MFDWKNILQKVVILISRALIWDLRLFTRLYLLCPHNLDKILKKLYF